MAPVDANTALWWMVIGIGVVVVLCVATLLSLLSAFVTDIGGHVDAVVVQLQHLAVNTGAHPHVHETAHLIGALDVELQAHNTALGRSKGPL